MLQTAWLVNSRALFLTVLDAGSGRSRFQHDWMRAFFQVADCLVSLSTYAEGAGTQDFFNKGTNFPHELSALLLFFLLTYWTMLGLSCSMQDFCCVMRDP